MKKVVTVIIIISWVALALSIMSLIIWGKDVAIRTFVVLFPFIIPIIFHKGGLSLAKNRTKMQPKTWLIIYGVAVAIYLIVILLLAVFVFPT
ncbi:MAG: hypothetical protein LBH28_08225 [Oscillospiraceae bacterium]|nr:hypothetical protein [Oscillospiraceae bacterium]